VIRDPLSAEFVAATRERFDRDGFIVLDRGLSAEEVARANAALDAAGPPAVGDLRPLIDKGAPFLDHLLHPAVLPYALALLGGNLLVMGSAATVIPPGAEPMVWHEDGPRPWPYPAMQGQRALVTVRFGIFLEDLTAPKRGNLKVVPGSHKRPFHTWDHRAGEAPQGATEILAPAGGIVLFHNALWHSTAPNEMDHPRRVLYYGFAPGWHRVVDYVTPPQHLLDAIEERPADERALLRQLVGAVPPSDAPGFYFPEPAESPGLDLITPEHEPSGYD